MRASLFTFLTVAGLVAASAAPSLAGSVTINPSLDTSLYEENDNSNAKGSLFAGATGDLSVRRALMKFDIAGSVPAGSTISSVTLTLIQTRIGGGGAATFELHPVSAAWGEGTSTGAGQGGAPTAGDATWNYRVFGTTKWSNAGGDFGSASASSFFDTSNGPHSFSSAGMVTDVGNWLSSPSSNFGWILLASNEGTNNSRQFGSRESSADFRPQLKIDFTPAVTAVPEPSTMVLAGIGVLGLLARRRLAI